MLDSSKMVSNIVKANSGTQMVISTKDSLWMDFLKVQESIFGKMAALLEEILNKAWEMAMDCGRLIMEESNPIKDITQWTKNQGTAFMFGTMDGPTKEILKTIFEMAMDSSTTDNKN